MEDARDWGRLFRAGDLEGRILHTHLKGDRVAQLDSRRVTRVILTYRDNRSQTRAAHRPGLRVCERGWWRSGRGWWRRHDSPATVRAVRSQRAVVVGAAFATVVADTVEGQEDAEADAAVGALARRWTLRLRRGCGWRASLSRTLIGIQEPAMRLRRRSWRRLRERWCWSWW